MIGMDFRKVFDRKARKSDAAHRVLMIMKDAGIVTIDIRGINFTKPFQQMTDEIRDDYEANKSFYKKKRVEVAILERMGVIDKIPKDELENVIVGLHVVKMVIGERREREHITEVVNTVFGGKIPPGAMIRVSRLRMPSVEDDEEDGR